MQAFLMDGEQRECTLPMGEFLGRWLGIAG